MWWRKSSGTKDSPRADADVPETVGEFESADALDNDVRPDVRALAAADRALEALRGRHLAFRRPEKCEECSLEELRLSVLTAVTEDPALESYYREAWGLPASPSDHAPTALTPAHRRVAVMQIELMSRAFYLLQLHLFANAPENFGWMALFRKWGRSRLFDIAVTEMKRTLAPDVVKFYRLYVRKLPALASASKQLPIHHPWIRPEKARGRGVYMDSGRMEAEIEVRPGDGSVIDQRGAQGADQTFEEGPDTPPG